MDHTDAFAAADRFFEEVDHLDDILADSVLHIELALSVAKRARRASTILVQALANERDNQRQS
jgi:hypothetical protein